MEGNEAPTPIAGLGEPQTEAPVVVRPTLTALIADTCSSLLDAVAVIDRIEAKQDAWKIEFIDQARRVAETANHGLVTVGSTLTVRQQKEMVRRSFVAEVAAVLRIPESTATQLIDDSTALMHRLPVTLAALRQGEISLRHARIIADNTSTLTAENIAVFESRAVPFARTLTVSRFGQKARILRERIDADSIVERRQKSATDRRVEFTPAPNGMAWLSLYTTAPEAASLYTGIRDAAVRLHGLTERRTMTQLGADVCADALAAGLTTGGTAGATAGSVDGTTGTGGTTVGSSDGTTTSTADPGATAGRAVTAFGRITPTVVVTVPALTLMGVSEEPGDLAGYGPIDPETARRLAGQAKTWWRLLTDPDTGVPLMLGRTRYRPTTQMRQYLQLRDGTCSFTGCNRQAIHCQIDHTQAWEFGGRTDCDNLAHLCPKHHRLKHNTTWHPEQIGGGTIRWTSPDGRTYVTEPDIHFLPPPGGPPSSDASIQKPAPPAPPGRQPSAGPGIQKKATPTPRPPIVPEFEDTPPF